MTTYFTQSNIMKRFFFLVGKTKDTFVDESLSSYDLEYMVFDHLKKLGYERIMFYGKVQKLFWCCLAGKRPESRASSSCHNHSKIVHP